MDTAQEFITNFHNIKGFTVGEKHKNFFQLLNSLKTLDSSTLDSITQSLAPQTHLESVFQVHFLIYFKRSKELFEVLKKGNEQLSADIFKNPWFFQHPFDGLSADEIVNNLLPNLSFVSRNRLIRWLAKYNQDERKLGEVFDCLLERYGIQTAKLILAGCSTDKIETIFSNHQVTLTPADLRLIFNKNPYVYQAYMKNYCQYGEGHSKIITDMILTEPDMFFDLKEKIYVDLGKRQTKRLLIHDKNLIITNSHKFRNMHFKTVCKFLGKKDRIIFLKNLFPEDIQYLFFKNVYKFLKYFPKFEQVQVFSETFQNVYKRPLHDNVKYVHDCLLETIQNTDEREKWIELKIKDRGSQDGYLQYYDTSKAVNLIQGKITSTKSEKIKNEMVKKLILTCKINNDLVSLVNVLEYLHKQHRNATDCIKKTILSTLNSTFDLTKLSEQHWKIINAILKNFKVNDDRFKDDKIICLKYILFLWKNKQPIKEKFIEIFKNGDINYDDFESINGLRNDELVRYLIDIVIEVTPYIEPKNDEPYWNDIKCIYWIISWNSSHPSSKISLFDYPNINFLTKYIEKSCSESSYYNWHLKSLFKNFICNKFQSNIKNAVIDIYFKSALNRYSSDFIALWLLKNDPEVLSKYTNYFIPNWSDRNCPMLVWDYFKSLSHYDFYDKMIKHCVEEFNKGSSRQLIVLARLMQPEDFVNLISKHVPVAERMDIEDEDSKNSYKVYTDIAESFKYTKSATVLPTLGKFCVGDYLCSALESLYYLFYHSPENKLDALLVELSTRAVSVRKHVYFLTSQVGTVEAMLKLLESAGRDEKNVSVKKHILNITLRYFRKNPSDTIFELLKTCIPNLNIVDTETLNSLVQLREVPPNYQSKFFVFLLEYLRSKASESDELNEVVNKFLEYMSDDLMKDLPSDFCISFIEKYFLQDSPYFSKSNVNDFTIKYLMFCDDVPDRKINFIFNKLAFYKNSIPNDLKTKVITNRNLNDIMDGLFCKIKYSEVEVTFIQNIYNVWSELFSVEDYFGVYIKFRVGLLKQKSNDISVYAKNIYNLLEEIFSQYGYDFIGNIASSVQWWSDYSDKHYLLCFHLWECSQSVANCMLILKLISSQPPKEPTYCDRYYELLEALEMHQDMSVKILFNVFVKSLEC